MAPAAFRRHRERGGEKPPSSSSSLTFSLDGRRVSPLVLGLHGMGGARAPPRLDLSLSVSAFCSSTLSPFRIYMEIRNSDWTETFTVIFYQNFAFLRPKKGINRLTGWPRGPRVRPLPRGPLGHRLALILLPKNHIYSKKNLHHFLSRLDSVWYGFSAKQKTCNKQELALGTGSIC